VLFGRKIGHLATVPKYNVEYKIIEKILLGWLFLETSYERLGLLLLGCSPGGAKSNFWVSTITK
jgi:hypothetical protein